MDAAKGLELVPSVALEHIASYLSPADLSRCCAVSKAWHELFCSDLFWKKHCDLKLAAYLDKTTSSVVQHFGDRFLLQSSSWRFKFLRERQLWKNWKLRSYTSKEIEFDCDDTISYNIQVESVASDYVFLHTTFETQVWDVSDKPDLIMTIPFHLAEMWENNLYKVVENKLVIVQCNVVQVFTFCLVSKSWQFSNAFFFNKPEEFSSNITENSDINQIFNETSHHIGDNVEHIICGDIFVGIATDQLSLKTPIMHIWNIKTGKKIKEEGLRGNKSFYLKPSETSTEEIVVASLISGKRHFSIYSLKVLKFIGTQTISCSNGDSLLHDRYLWTHDEGKVKVYEFNPENSDMKIINTFSVDFLNFWHVLKGVVLIAIGNEIRFFNPQEKNDTPFLRPLPGIIFMENFEVVQNRIIFFEIEKHLTFYWEIFGKDSDKMDEEIWGEQLCVLLPGVYRATNDVATKVILEKNNRLIVCSFW